MSKKVKDSIEILQTELENLQRLNQELSLENAESKAKLRSLARENELLCDREKTLEKSIAELKEYLGRTQGNAYHASAQNGENELKESLYDLYDRVSSVEKGIRRSETAAELNVEGAKYTADMIIRQANAQKTSILSSAEEEARKIVAAAKQESDRIISDARGDARRLYGEIETAEADIGGALQRLDRLHRDISSSKNKFKG